MAKETELCFWARVTNTSGYGMADAMEIHDQYSYKIPGKENPEESSGMIRVRATTKGQETEYEETLKSKIKDSSLSFANTELNTKISEDYFKTWIAAFDAEGCHKVRYTYLAKDSLLTYEGKEYTMPAIPIEVDVFISREGKRSAFVKIDIELDSIHDWLEENHVSVKEYDMTVVLSKLPLGLTDIFSAVTDDPEKKEAIEGFWKTFTYKDSERVK